MLEDRRFLRTKALLGDEGLDKLINAHVMIVGLGAVGGYALEALARSGIGKFTLVDMDTIEETNINRQILALSSTIGIKKIDAAKARVLDINPNCQVELIDLFVNTNTVDSLLDVKPDFVVDAIDSLNPKCCMMEALYRANIPFVSSMGAALKSKFELIKLSKLSETEHCRLAKFIRKRLRKRDVDMSKILCVSSMEEVDLPETAIFMEETAGDRGRARHTLGSLPTMTAIFGLVIANHVIKTLSGFK